MKIVALDIQTLFTDAEDPECIGNHEKELKSLYDHDDQMVYCSNLNLNHYAGESEISKAVAEAVAGADVVITNKVKLNRSNLNPGIKLILVSGTGTNNISFPDTDALGIRVQNCVAYTPSALCFHSLTTLPQQIAMSDRGTGTELIISVYAGISFLLNCQVPLSVLSDTEL